MRCHENIAYDLLRTSYLKYASDLCSSWCSLIGLSLVRPSVVAQCGCLNFVLFHVNVELGDHCEFFAYHRLFCVSLAYHEIGLKFVPWIAFVLWIQLWLKLIWNSFWFSFLFWMFLLLSLCIFPLLVLKCTKCNFIVEFDVALVRLLQLVFVVVSWLLVPTSGVFASCGSFDLVLKWVDE